MERIEKVRNVATWNVRRILYFEPVFEFPLSCHVQILDLPTRFVKLLAKLSSPQQRSTDFLYLPCKLFHNIYTIILEPSPPSLYTFFSRQLYCFLFLLIPTTVTCVYIYITTIRRIEKRAMHFIDRCLSLSNEIPYPRPNNSPSSSFGCALSCQSFARLRPSLYFSSNFSRVVAEGNRRLKGYANGTDIKK